MSQLSEAMGQVKSGNWQLCPKHKIMVTGCSKYFECEECCGLETPTYPYKSKKKGIKGPIKAVKGKRIKTKKVVKRTAKKEINPPKIQKKGWKFGGSKYE